MKHSCHVLRLPSMGWPLNAEAPFVGVASYRIGLPPTSPLVSWASAQSGHSPNAQEKKSDLWRLKYIHRSTVSKDHRATLLRFLPSIWFIQRRNQTWKVRNRFVICQGRLNFARRGNESTYISVSIWNTLLFPPTSDLIYRMKWQTDVCIPDTRSPTILKTSLSSWIMKTVAYFAATYGRSFETSHFVLMQ